jgi:hypothetical protein
LEIVLLNSFKGLKAYIFEILRKKGLKNIINLNKKIVYVVFYKEEHFIQYINSNGENRNVKINVEKIVKIVKYCDRRLANDYLGV